MYCLTNSPRLIKSNLTTWKTWEMFMSKKISGCLKLYKSVYSKCSVNAQEDLGDVTVSQGKFDNN